MLMFKEYLARRFHEWFVLITRPAKNISSYVDHYKEWSHLPTAGPIDSTELHSSDLSNWVLKITAYQERQEPYLITP